ncbi:C-type mannose receptor 2-like [Ylistrum balloti]|uniref:C-type mannose receptor 2-like n=1 Tax=Ylistrum balloti TaxID=509963 RepID=UPI002905C0C5|nr:C-type mannose receptor 2-like [Ylistrum balloti]
MVKTAVMSLVPLVLGFVTVYGSLVDDLRDCLPFLPRTQYVKSYNDVCLFLLKRKLTWNDAQSNCSSGGGRLVQIQYQAKQDFLYNTLTAMKWTDWGVWIGATDHDSEGTWKWTDGTNLTYGFWHPGEGPAHGFLFSKAGFEDCALMRLDDSGRWRDYDCGSILHHHTSVCEYQKVKESTSYPPKTTTLPTTTVPTIPSSPSTLSTTVRQTCPSFHPEASLVQYYKKSCLRFVIGDKSWNDANAECISQGGLLLQIHSQQDQDFVYQSLKSLRWSDAGAWIGATDRDGEGHWTWTDGSPVNYGHWNPGEGSYHNTTNENCAMINVDDGMWYDYNCGSVIYNQAYICQYRL